MATRVEAIQVTARTLRQGSWLNLGHVGRGSGGQPQLGSWASGCAATLRGCCCGRVPVLRPSLCVSAFSCPIKMNQLDSLNYNMNIKLSKETHFPRTQEAGPQHTHTETALGVFPKGIAAPSWSELSVERGSCPDGPGRQPAAEVSSNRAKGKCLSLHDRSQPSLPHVSSPPGPLCFR